MRAVSKKRITGRLFHALALVVICLFTLLPFLWMISISFRNKADVFFPGKVFSGLTSANYETIFSEGIMKLFVNSAIISPTRTPASTTSSAISWAPRAWSPSTPPTTTWSRCTRTAR